jgi:hypothetical protein
MRISKHFRQVFLKAMPQFTQLVASFLLQEPRFKPIVVNAGFMVDKVALGQVLSSASYHYINSTHSSSVAGIPGPSEATVPRVSISHHFYNSHVPFICVAIHNAADIT